MYLDCWILATLIRAADPNFGAWQCSQGREPAIVIVEMGDLYTDELEPVTVREPQRREAA